MIISSIIGGLFALVAAVIQAWATLQAGTCECSHKSDPKNELD